MPPKIGHAETGAAAADTSVKPSKREKTAVERFCEDSRFSHYAVAFDVNKMSRIPARVNLPFFRDIYLNILDKDFDKIFGKADHPFNLFLEFQQEIKINEDFIERTHNCIQLLFPLTRQSGACQAILLNKLDIQTIQEKEELTKTVLLNFLLMLKFYGFSFNVENLASECRAHQIKIIAPKEIKYWMKADDHNHLRITRILQLLFLLGLDNYANEFFGTLEKMYKKNGVELPANTVKFWNGAHNWALQENKRLNPELVQSLLLPERRLEVLVRMIESIQDYFKTLPKIGSKKFLIFTQSAEQRHEISLILMQVLTGSPQLQFAKIAGIKSEDFVSTLPDERVYEAVAIARGYIASTVAKDLGGDSNFTIEGSFLVMLQELIDIVATPHSQPAPAAST
jgi:hypothetical protein